MHQLTTNKQRSELGILLAINTESFGYDYFVIRFRFVNIYLMFGKGFCYLCNTCSGYAQRNKNNLSIIHFHFLVPEKGVEPLPPNP